MMSIVKIGKEVVIAFVGASLGLVLGWVLLILVFLSISLILLAQYYLLGQTHEEFQRFNLSNGRSIVIYCEHEWFYEPPGFVYYDVVENGKTLVSKRVFQGVGVQHAPFDKFKMVSADNDNLVAITFVSNVVIMHDFRTNRSWPGNYFRRDDTEEYLLAKELIIRFLEEGKKLYCDAVERSPQKEFRSFDCKRSVSHGWKVNEDLEGCYLKVRMLGQKGQNYSLFDLYFAAKDLEQRNDKQWKAVNAQWKAGWLDVDTFAVSNDKFGTRVWQYREDDSFVELPQPIDSQLEERIMSLQSSPWRRPPALDIIRKVKEMELKKSKDGN